MYKEVKHYLNNKTFSGINFSQEFLVSLLKWAKVETLINDSNVINRSLEIFKLFFENKDIVNYSYKIRNDFYTKMENDFGYTSDEILHMLINFNKKFIDCEKTTKFIAIEGIDGSGKTEQTNLLKNLLESENNKVLVLSFPVYKSFFGKQIGYLLSGEGKIDANDVDCKSMSLWYALDRYSEIRKIDFSKFDFVIFNRYTLSSAVYQSVRNGNDEIIDWIFKLENHELNLPVPDLYLILDVNVNQSNSNVLKKEQRSYLESDKDVYEKSRYLLENARNKYISISKKYINTEIVNCNDNLGNLRSIEQIHKSIKEKLEKWNLLSTIH